jgi:DNA invertase Pin-like site-specific DNA recombinase
MRKQIVKRCQSFREHLRWLLQTMRNDDILIVTEVSRLGCSLFEVMSILHTLMEKDVKVFYHQGAL